MPHRGSRPRHEFQRSRRLHNARAICQENSCHTVSWSDNNPQAFAQADLHCSEKHPRIIRAISSWINMDDARRGRRLTKPAVPPEETDLLGATKFHSVTSRDTAYRDSATTATARKLLRTARKREKIVHRKTEVTLPNSGNGYGPREVKPPPGISPLYHYLLRATVNRSGRGKESEGTEQMFSARAVVPRRGEGVLAAQQCQFSYVPGQYIDKVHRGYTSALPRQKGYDNPGVLAPGPLHSEKLSGSSGSALYEKSGIELETNAWGDEVTAKEGDVKTIRKVLTDSFLGAGRGRGPGNGGIGCSRNWLGGRKARSILTCLKPRDLEVESRLLCHMLMLSCLLTSCVLATYGRGKNLYAHERCACAGITFTVANVTVEVSLPSEECVQSSGYVHTATTRRGEHDLPCIIHDIGGNFCTQRELLKNHSYPRAAAIVRGVVVHLGGSEKQRDGVHPDAHRTPRSPRAVKDGPSQIASKRLDVNKGACVRPQIAFRVSQRSCGGRRRYGGAHVIARGGETEIPEKTPTCQRHRPARSPHAKIRERPRPGIEPISPRWDASSLTTTPPRPLSPCWSKEYRPAIRELFAESSSQSDTTPIYRASRNPIRDSVRPHKKNRHTISYLRGVENFADEDEGGGNGEIPEKTRRPATSSGTIPTCENPGATLPGLESGEPTWKTSSLIATPP
ncbi:hypothetical protein PR048_030486 [Dryococelus australis]|uniref:Uncharacterized protein n=1 Tax=Dryococelus australis TaxID=614101 RepID=A0ABQ9G953_9NEOP|nr:hypothetical protein PR048_030486 [Dryococelus australis]